MRNRTESSRVLPILFVAALATVAMALAITGAGFASAAGKAVSIKTVKGAKVFVDSKGKTLYSPVQEKSGNIVCVGACASIWKPVKITGATQFSGVHGGLGTVNRPDGSKQLAFHKHPLYSFTIEGKGALTGDGVKDSFGGKSFTWHAARVSGGGSPSPSPSPYGY